MQLPAAPPSVVSSMSKPAWEEYVVRLCVDAWSFDPATIINVVTAVESLITSDAATGASIATALQLAGVPRAEAESTAEIICAAIHRNRCPASPLRL
jgi:hypothetical protein